jgi:hypothetical protein
MVPDFEEGKALGMIHSIPQVQRAILNITMQQAVSPRERSTDSPSQRRKR